MTFLFWIYSSLWLTASPIIVNAENPLEVVRHGPGSDMRCMSPLMDTEDKLPDAAFTASSVYRNTEGFQPHHARLVHVYDGKEHVSGHAWCPSNTVQTSMKEWIQVEFPTLVIIGIIFTAGRGDGNVKEFTPSYVIHYQREDEEWFEYKKSDADRVIDANSDPRTIIRNTLDPAIVARRLRIYPYSARVQQQICLRFALYGCEFKDGIVGYSVPEGVRGGGFGSNGRPGLDQFDFRDTVNDRFSAMQTSHAGEGLGKLVDNIAYLGNVTRDVEVSPGSHFVGWDSGYNGRRASVQLRFKFDAVRNFSAVCLFTFDSPRLRASLFKRATVDFSDEYDDHNYAEERRLQFPLATARVKHLEGSLQSDWRQSLYQQLGPDTSGMIIRHSHWDGATVVVLPLQGRLGRSVRLDLVFADTWLLLSEIEFISVPHTPPPVESSPNGSTDEEVVPAPENAPTRGSLKGGRKADTPEASNAVRSDGNGDPNTFEVDEADHFSSSDDDAHKKQQQQQQQNRRQTARSERTSSNGHRNIAFIVIVIACSLFTMAVLGVAVAFCFHMRLRQTRNKQPQSLKKIASDTGGGGVCGFSVNEFGGRGGPNSPTGGAQVPTPYLLGPAFKAANVGTMHSGGSMGDGKSPYSNLFQMFSSPGGNQHAPLSVFAPTGFANGHDASGNAVRDSGGMGTAFQGLPSPGHAFVGGAGDLNSLSMCQPMLAMQMRGQHPAIFFSAPAGQTMPLLGGTGLIHPGGDTTTDSGSLYTTPPDVCGVPELANKHLSSQFSSTSYGRSGAFRHNSAGDGQEDEGDGDYNSSSGDGGDGGSTSESDPEDANQNRRPRPSALRPVNRASSLGPECTSSECAQQQMLLLRPSKGGEKLRRPSADAKVDPRPKRSHSFVAAERTNAAAEEDEEEPDDDELSQNDEFNDDASAGVALLADRNNLVSRWNSAQGELRGSSAASSGKTKRRRSKRQRQRNGKPVKRALEGCTETTVATSAVAPSSQRHQTASSLQDSVLSSSHQLHSCADSGLGSSRAEVPPSVQPRRSGVGRGVAVSNAQFQQFIQQQQQQQQQYPHLSADTLASNSVSLTSVLPGISVVSSPLAARHYGSNSVTPLGGFMHAHPQHQHFAAFPSLSDQASVSTAMSIGPPGYTGVCASAEDAATMQSSQSGGFGGGGSMLPGSPYHLYQPPVGTTILLPSAPSAAFPGGQPTATNLQPQFLSEHQVGLLQGGGGGAQVLSPSQHFRPQAEQKKQTPNHSETDIVSSGVGNSWSHTSATDQLNPTDVSTSSNWSETLKLKSAACPLPPVPSLPMPLTPMTAISTAAANGNPTNNPYGDVQRDGTSSGRLSIYSVCM